MKLLSGCSVLLVALFAGIPPLPGGAQEGSAAPPRVGLDLSVGTFGAPSVAGRLSAKQWSLVVRWTEQKEGYTAEAQSRHR